MEPLTTLKENQLVDGMCKKTFCNVFFLIMLHHYILDPLQQPNVIAYNNFESRSKKSKTKLAEGKEFSFLYNLYM